MSGKSKNFISTPKTTLSNPYNNMDKNNLQTKILCSCNERQWRIQREVTRSTELLSVTLYSTKCISKCVLHLQSLFTLTIALLVNVSQVLCYFDSDPSFKRSWIRLCSTVNWKVYFIVTFYWWTFFFPVSEGIFARSLTVFIRTVHKNRIFGWCNPK